MESGKKRKFFYGWIVVACLFLIATFPMVFLSNFYSYYQVPICNEFGSSYVDSNIASTVAGMCFSLFAASKITKGNTRWFMFIGGVVAAVAILAQSYITSLWQLYITFFVANFAFSAMTYVPINFLISRWFVDKKALVTSIVFAGSGLGGMIFSGLAAGIIADMGWRAGFRVTALIVAVTAVVVLLLVRKTPEEMGLEPYRKENAAAAQKAQAAAQAPSWAGLSKGEAVKTTSFWLYALCLICCGIAAAGIATQVPTYLIENGIDYAPVMAVFSGAGIVGKLVIGPIIDKVGISKGSILTAVIAVVSMVFLAMVSASGAWAGYASMAILPFGAAITSLAPPLLTGLCFGQKDFGGIYGLGNTFFMAGCMVGPMLTSGIRMAAGSYQVAWYVCMVVYALIAIGAVLAVSASKKLRTAQ